MLADSGVRQTTIEALAGRCGLSKAGLLHHFGSRAALDTALLERLRNLVHNDLAAMQTAPEGAVHYYLASSMDSGSTLERSVVAATRLAHVGNLDAGAVLRWARDRWYEIILRQLEDPLLARLAVLAGDGMSYHTDISETSDDRFIEQSEVSDIARLFDSFARRGRTP